MPFDLATFTAIHTALSIVALIAGAVVVAGLFDARSPTFWTPLFLVMAIATSVTGFGFPFSGLLPSHVVGGIALLVLALVLVARYVQHFQGFWRWLYAAVIVVSEYFLVFVLIAQAFTKIPLLRSLAPTQSEAPFAVTQLVLLALFVVLGIAAARRFRGGASPT